MGLKSSIEWHLWLFIKKTLLGFLYWKTHERYLIIPENTAQAFLTKTGDLFYPTEGLSDVNEVYRDYDLSGIGNDDSVLDIGANIGGFTIYAAKRAKKVIAIEPVNAKELQANIHLNNLQNVEVIEGALASNPGPVLVSWKNKEKEVPGYTFQEIMEKTGPIDFLKCDCEGAEWSIDPRDLKNIRRIELELHRMGDYRKYPLFMKELNDHFNLTKVDKGDFCILHGVKRIK
jgi:FkbM family methyltransferase